MKYRDDTAGFAGQGDGGDTFALVVENPDTGIPEPVQMDRSSLVQLLSSNPSVILDSLQDILRRGGGATPGARPPRGPLPLDSSIQDMLPKEQLDRLSPAARALTKSDLLALGGWSGRRKPQELGLGAKDIQSIRDVFSAQLDPTRVGGGFNPAAADVSCCCCTPCCCAAAEMTPVRLT